MIVVCEYMSPGGLARLQESGLGVFYDPELWKDRAALKAHLAGALALIVRNQTRVDAELLAAAPHLRAVGRLGAGLDNIVQPDLEARGVVLCHARGLNATAVAEYVLAAMLHLARNLAKAAAHVAAGGWDRSAFGGFELAGKTLGLLGLGEVGLRVARRARALGMRVLAADPARQPWEAVVEDLGIELCEVPQLLARARFLSLHAPLTPETRYLIRAETLTQMPRGAYLINTARGELVHSADLAKALWEGHLAGAVLDVVEPEPLPESHPLRGVPNLYITPHIAGLTAEAQEAVGLWVAEGVLRALGVEA
ncbi:hydroxyacid dehydrogenase [Meiothermus sp. QL-1]|uniref:hydroxyacid dehydrogenase n=1 Tax=Meiothermus sp. QL-1 TaxID=2058095 RepID=UPI000E0B057D|nr:hydroxyacid dehydrogenase [Meiothermus sp. QL-1]RDI95227.1 hydroxyacid dehydrogenase [Meiothermus sp. QL-1]